LNEAHFCNSLLTCHLLDKIRFYWVWVEVEYVSGVAVRVVRLQMSNVKCQS